MVTNEQPIPISFLLSEAMQQYIPIPATKPFGNLSSLLCFYSPPRCQCCHAPEHDPLYILVYNYFGGGGVWASRESIQGYPFLLLCVSLNCKGGESPELGT